MWFSSKTYISLALVISSFLKILPFLSKSLRQKQYDLLKLKALEKEAKFYIFFTYFEKVWINSDFINLNTTKAISEISFF